MYGNKVGNYKRVGALYSVAEEVSLMTYEITISGFKSGLTELAVEDIVRESLNLREDIDVEVTQESEE